MSAGSCFGRIAKDLLSAGGAQADHPNRAALNRKSQVVDAIPNAGERRETNLAVVDAGIRADQCSRPVEALNAVKIDPVLLEIRLRLTGVPIVGHKQIVATKRQLSKQRFG